MCRLCLCLQPVQRSSGLLSPAVMYSTRKTWDLGHGSCLQELWKKDISLDGESDVCCRGGGSLHKKKRETPAWLHFWHDRGVCVCGGMRGESYLLVMNGARQREEADEPWVIVQTVRGTGEVKTPHFIYSFIRWCVCFLCVGFSQLIVFQSVSQETTGQVNNTAAIVRESGRGEIFCVFTLTLHSFHSSAGFMLIF